MNPDSLYGLNPANTTRWNDDVLMLAQRLWRWPNIKTSSFQRVVFAGNMASFDFEDVDPDKYSPASLVY